MLQEQHMFELLQLASWDTVHEELQEEEDDDDGGGRRRPRAALASGADLVLAKLAPPTSSSDPRSTSRLAVLLRGDAADGRLVSAALTHRHASSEDAEAEEEEGDVRHVPWFSTGGVAATGGGGVSSWPRSAQCLCLSPDEDFLLLATRDGELFLLPTDNVLWPRRRAPQKAARDGTGQPDRHYPDWSLTGLTRITKESATSSSEASSSSTTKTATTTTSANQQRQMQPTSLLWWNPQDFQPAALMGTRAGTLRAINLATGVEMNSTPISSAALTHLETITDNASDCTHVILTDEEDNQWRLLLEQRSTAYVWAGGAAAAAKLAAAASSSACQKDESSGAAAAKSRLAGLRQFSAAGLANLRQKISEGKKILDRRVASASSSDASSEPETGTIAESFFSCPQSVQPEPLASKIGDTRVSVQRNSAMAETAESAADRQNEILAGIFPDTAILTLHNSELEVMPQSAYKLPRGTDRVLLMPRLIVAAARVGVNNNSSSKPHPHQRADDFRGQLHVVSSFFAELHLEGSQTESVLQSFTLQPGEVVLRILRRNTVHPSSPSLTPPHSSSSSSSSLSSQVDGGGEDTSSQEGKLDFSSRVRSRVDQMRQKGLHLVPPCLVVTNRALYELRLDQDPNSTFLELAMRTESAKKLENLSLAFGLETRWLLELAGDIRLSERDFSAAITLYRLAGCKHLKVVLKFASSGHIQELLSYLNVLFKTPNLGVTPADRIHLSNLALMSYFQQVLTKTTPTARGKFQGQIQAFLDENAWFDECLAVRMATETREWDLLSHLSRCHGLGYEMVASIVSIVWGGKAGGGQGQGHGLKNSVQHVLAEMPASERNGLLACLLHQHNIESVIVNVQLGTKLLSVLNDSLSLLEQPGLLSILAQCGPANHGLRPIYLMLLRDLDNSRRRAAAKKKTTTTADFVVQLLNLFVVSALLLLKKRSGSSSAKLTSSCDSVPKRYLKGGPLPAQPTTKSKVTSGWRSLLSAGSSHVLLCRNDSLLSWGMVNHGVLGHGATGARYSTPKEVDYFSQARIRVLSVACGKTHSLALTDCGLYSWGSSKHGQLGLGRQRINEQRPVLVPALANHALVAVAVGQYHSVALDDQGRAYTWGWGVHGQLGNGNIEDIYVPERIFCKKSLRVRDQHVVQIGCGYAHTLLLTNVGEVWAFGCGLFGQLGSGENKKSSVPLRVRIEPGLRVRTIECGFFHNIAMLEGREEGKQHLLTWGCSPQILRLEAQQKRRMRMQKEMKKGVLMRQSSNQPGMRQQQQQLQVQIQQQQQLQIQQQQQQQQQQQPSSILKDIRKQAKQAFDDMRSHDNCSGGGASDHGHTAAPDMLNGEEQTEQQQQQQLQQELVTSTGEDGSTAEAKESTPSAADKLQHLLPTPLDVSTIHGTITQITCGNQHSMLLTDQGHVYAVGRNVDGQLGNNSRKPAKQPVLLPSLNESSICYVACGNDYSLALGESGTVFGWGNNSSGQLGRPPLANEDDEGSAGGVGGPGGKVVVMKSTRRFIRLQNNMQNSCDVPRPVAGITDGVYSDVAVKAERIDEGVAALAENIRLGGAFATAMEVNGGGGDDGDDVETRLHVCLEMFHAHLDVKKLIKCCLVSDNPGAAAKLSLLGGQILPAFDFSLQLSVRHGGARVAEQIFGAFLFYLRESSSSSSESAASALAPETTSEQRRQLLERLIACWQDQKFSFLQLEQLFNRHSDPLLLQTLVRTLFCPEQDRRTDAGPVLDDLSPKLVDLFTPEFCLKIGDRFVGEVKRTEGDKDKRAASASLEWLKEQQQRRREAEAAVSGQLENVAPDGERK